MKIYFVPHRQKLEFLQLQAEWLHPKQQKKQLTTKYLVSFYFSIYLWTIIKHWELNLIDNSRRKPIYSKMVNVCSQ